MAYTVVLSFNIVKGMYDLVTNVYKRRERESHYSVYELFIIIDRYNYKKYVKNKEYK